MSIHQWAIVDPAAELADEVEVQAFTIIGPHVKIGAGTVVGPHCVITGRTTIGKNNQIFSGAQIGIPSQDKKHREGLIGRTEIGDDNVLREHITISASTLTSFDDEHRVTQIGNGCWVMAYCHVAHDCHLGNNIVMANYAQLSGHVDVEDHAVLGGMCGIHQECVIGLNAFVGGMARVVKDVAPFMTVEGHPARCCGLNKIGLQRNGYDADALASVKNMYRIMFRSDLNTQQALEEIDARVPECRERQIFVEFFRKSIRGVTK